MAKTITIRITGSSAGLEAALGRSAAAAQAFGARVANAGRSMTAVGRSMTRNFTLPIVGAGFAAVKLREDFDDSLDRIVGLVGVSRKQVNSWSKDMLELGPKVGKSPKELADALFFVTSAGLRGSKAIEVLTASAKASSAGLGETKVVADAITSAVNSYGTANLSAEKAADVLVATVREGKVEASALAPVLGRLLPLSSELGVGFNEVGAAIAAMTRKGSDAAGASTQLRSVMTGILKPSKGAQDAMASVGLSAEGLRTELREKGLLATLTHLRDAFGGNTAEIAKAFPNLRGLLGLLGLVGKGGKDYADISKRMEDSTGSLRRAFRAVSEDEGFKFQAALAGIKAAAISFGAAIAPLAAQLAGWVQSLAGAFGDLSPHTQKLIGIGLAIAAALGPVLSIFGGLVTAVGLLLSPIGLVVAALAALGIGVGIAAWKNEEFRAKLQAAAEWIRTNWPQIRAVIETVARSIASAFSAVATAIGAVAGFIIRHWDSIRAGAQATIDWLKTNVGPVFEGIAQMVSRLVTVAQRLWDVFGGALTAIGQNLASFAQAALGPLRGIAEGVLKIVSGLLQLDFARVWEGLKQVGSNAGRLLLEGLKAAGSLYLDVGKELGGKVVSGLKLGMSKLGELGGWIVDQVKSGLGALADWARVQGLKVVKGIVEPFSHLPREAGQWARNTKDYVDRELAKIKGNQATEQLREAFSKLTPAIRREAEAGRGAWVKAFDEGGKAIIKFIPASATKAGQQAGKAVSEAVEAARPAAAKAGDALGKGASEGVGKGGAQMGAKAKAEAGKVPPAVAAFGGPASAAGFGVGAAAGAGVASGLQSQLGAVRAAAAAIANAAAAAMRSAAQISSPSKVTYKIGSQLGEGVKLGFLDDTRDLPDKVAERLQNVLERGKQAVLGGVSGWQSAFSRLSDDAFAAFDAKTARLLAALDTRLAAARSGIDRQLAAINANIDQWLRNANANIDRELARALAAADKALSAAERRIAAKREAKTPAERALAAAEAQEEQIRKQREVADATRAIAEAEAALSAARAKEGATPEEIAAAEQRLVEARQRQADVERQQQIAELRARAEAERQERDKRLAAEEEAARKKAERERAAAEKQANERRRRAEAEAAEARGRAERNAQAAIAQREKEIARLKLELESERALRRRQLQDMLDDHAAFLEKHPSKWRDAHAKIMGIFKSEFGPDFKEAGQNLGAGFAKGLTESMAGMQRAAAQLAGMIASYLKLRSPAERGPLADLDRWWKPLAPTLLSGLDVNAIDRALSDAIGRPVTAPIGAGAFASAGRGAGARGGDVHIHLHGGTYIGGNPEGVARELAGPIRSELLRTKQANGTLGLS